MLTISINDAEIKYLGIQLKQLTKITQNQRFLKETGQLLAGQGKKNIDEGSANGTISYQLLNKKTIKQKVKSFTPSRGKNKGITRRTGTAQPLIREGELRKSIAYKTSSGQLYLTALKYAAHHQYGAPKNNLPARPIFSIREENKIDIFQLIKITAQKLFAKKN